MVLQRVCFCKLATCIDHRRNRHGGSSVISTLWKSVTSAKTLISQALKEYQKKRKKSINSLYSVRSEVRLNLTSLTNRSELFDVSLIVGTMAF
jgi:hypothetical protein